MIVIRLSMLILLGLSAKNAKVVIWSKFSGYSQSKLNEKSEFSNSVVFCRISPTRSSGMSVRNCSTIVDYVWFVQDSGSRVLEEEVGITKISWCRVWMEEPFMIPFGISGVLTVTSLSVECGYSQQMASLIKCNSEIGSELTTRRYRRCEIFMRSMSMSDIEVCTPMYGSLISTGLSGYQQTVVRSCQFVNVTRCVGRYPSDADDGGCRI